MLTKCLGRENLELFFGDAPKSIWGPLQYTDYVRNRKKHITGACDIIEERHGILFTIQKKRAGHKAGVGNLWLASHMWLVWWRHLARFIFS